MQLRPEQDQIIRYMATQPEGVRVMWIAEGCGHFYDTQWAASRLPALVKRGLVAKQGLPGWYVLTDVGRAAARALIKSPMLVGEERL